jgi:hypothetical protein
MLISAVSRHCDNRKPVNTATETNDVFASITQKCKQLKELNRADTTPSCNLDLTGIEHRFAARFAAIEARLDRVDPPGGDLPRTLRSRQVKTSTTTASRQRSADSGVLHRKKDGTLDNRYNSSREEKRKATPSSMGVNEDWAEPTVPSTPLNRRQSTASESGSFTVFVDGRPYTVRSPGPYMAKVKAKNPGTVVYCEEWLHNP